MGEGDAGVVRLCAWPGPARAVEGSSDCAARGGKAFKVCLQNKGLACLFTSLTTVWVLNMREYGTDYGLEAGVLWRQLVVKADVLAHTLLGHFGLFEDLRNL